MSDDLNALREEYARLQAKLEALEGVATDHNHRSFLEGMSYAVLVHEHGMIRYANPAAARMLDAESPQDLLGRNALDLVHPDYVQSAAQRLDNIYKDKQASTTREAVMLTVHGRPIWVEVSGTPGEWMGKPVAQVVFLDITDRKRAEAEKLEHEHEMRHAQRMESLSRLGGGIAHELNNVLTGIMGHVELIEMLRSDDEELMGDVRQIRRAADRAADITRYLATFGRRRPANPQVVDITVMLNDLHKILARVLLRHELRIEPDADTWRVEIDPVQLEQVVMNLVFNARDAMGNDGSFTISSQNVSSDGKEWVQIQFSQVGEQRRPEMSSKFQPFFSEVSKDAALGLNTAREIIEEFGGSVRVQESANEVLVIVQLPRTTKQLTKPSRIDAARFGGDEHVLLVDDDPITRRVTRTILERAGYTVTSVVGVKTATEKLAEATFDLVLCDVVLPDGDGVDVKRIVDGRSPITFMSGYVDDHIEDDRLGDLDYLPKPYSSQSLLMWVRDALDD